VNLMRENRRLRRSLFARSYTIRVRAQDRRLAFRLPDSDDEFSLTADRLLFSSRLFIP